MQYRGSLLVVAFALACNNGGGALGTGTDAAAMAGIDAQTSGADGGAPGSPDAGVPGAPDATVPADAGSSEAALPSACGTPSPAPLRRLTNTQYTRTVKELTGVAITTPLPVELTVDGFEDRAFLLEVSGQRVADWNKTADEVVQALVPGLPALVGCPGAIDAGCARAFITSFGGRAYRRPLAPAEVDLHLALFTRVTDMGDASDGIAAVLRAMLQSPHFLYRLEVSGTVSGGRIALSPWEVATRMSYFLWGNMPDAELFRAAQAGELGTPQQVSVQARRMLLDPRARQGGNDFFRQWLSLDLVAGGGDAKDVPDWESAVAPALREEGYRFTQRVLFDGDGKFATLFTSPEGIINGRLAQLYGVAFTGTDWRSVDFTGKPRLGMLTQGWFLASNASGADSNPVRRGIFVRQRLLCQAVPAEPPDVGPFPPPQPGATTRERFQAHIANPVCASCHALIDPLGLPFESYDGTGTFRTTEKGRPIDSSGEITGTDVDGPVTDALGLSRRVAASSQARACLTRRWFELAVGRDSTEIDQCRTVELERLFRNSDGNLRQLMVDIATLAALAPRPATEVTPASPGQPLLVNPTIASKMVLDLVSSQVAQLRQRLALPEDRLRLDQHLSGLRDLERQLP